MKCETIIIQEISEQKEKYYNYCNLCKQMNVKPDPIATSNHEAILQTLDRVLQIIRASQIKS